MQTDTQVQREFQSLLRRIYDLSIDIGQEVEQAFERAMVQPLNEADATRLLTTVAEGLRNRAQARGDAKGAATLDGQVAHVVEYLMEAHDRLRRAEQRVHRKVDFVRDRGEPLPITPTPRFQERPVQMEGGWVRTQDLELWDANARLEIHHGQFYQIHGRPPTSNERLDIMMGHAGLPGTDEVDQFKIQALAHSIAVNGVRTPPIMDKNGTLLDGNRRVTACHYILNSEEFNTEVKRRIEYIYVWRLSDYADPDDRQAVVVSLNFEPSYKEEWPEYVKARQVYASWEAMLALEGRAGPSKQAQLKRDLTRKFALGNDTSRVNRYLKMVELANEFEDFHRIQRGRDNFEVQHRANKYFQYFDELTKGQSVGGVAWALNQDDAFKHLVFDLLYGGKFENWRQIRDLKNMYDNPEARDALDKARHAKDVEIAQEHMDSAFAIAKQAQAQAREVGANSRIESFVKWLEEVPPRSFRDHVKRENLLRLRSALRLIDGLAEHILTETQG